jgi:hypothetical protein
MLPLVSDQLCADLTVILRTPEQFTQWQKQMIRQLQESNPEVNALLLSLAQQSEDPKSTILAGFSVYQVLHWAYEVQRQQQPLPVSRSADITGVSASVDADSNSTVIAASS